MGGWVVVLEPHEYEEWLTGNRGEDGRLSSAEHLLTRYACDSCHRDDSSARAPKLAGLFGKSVQLQGGAVVEADDNYILESILNPNAKIVDGFKPIMPTFQGQMSSEEALTLVRYIRELRAPSATSNGTTAPRAADAQPGGE